MSEVEDLINCPNCAESIKADAILCSFCQYGLSREHFSECNYCGEMVRKGTLWCQYCKSSLIETEPAHGRSPRPLSGLKKSAEQPASEEGMAEIGLAKFQANQSLIRERVKVIVNRLRREVNLAVKSNFAAETAQQLRAQIRELVQADPAPLTMMEKGIMLQNVLDEVFGFGPLGPLLRDPSAGDVFVNGPAHVYVERNGRLERTTVTFENDAHLRQTIDKIIQPLGLRLDDESPVVKARLPNGSRVTATIPPASIDGPTLTIRCFGTSLMAMGHLVEKGSISTEVSNVLKACVSGRINIIISGSSGSGKSTLLSALSAHVGPQERIITIEDTADLRILHEHWVRLETRPPNSEGKGGLSAGFLISTSLRMRPDRIIVGDCLAEETLDFLMAMSSGQRGAMATVNAGSVRDCLERLENMILMRQTGTSAQAVRRLIANTVQLIVQINRLEDGRRRVTEVTEITGMDGETIATNTLFHLRRDGRDPRGFLMCHYASSGLPPKFLEQIEREAIPFKLEWLQ